jgi:hypothetical protein
LLLTVTLSSETNPDASTTTKDLTILNKKNSKGLETISRIRYQRHWAALRLAGA